MAIKTKCIALGNTALFPEATIASFLEGMNTSLPSVLQPLNKFIVDQINLDNVTSAPTIDVLKERLSSNASLVSRFFPIIYNKVSHQISMDDFLSCILEKQAHIGRTPNLLMWMPLFMPHISRCVETVIRDIIEAEKMDGNQTYKSTWKWLAYYADRWLLKVSNELTNDILSHATHHFFDHSTYHFVPTHKIPKQILEKGALRYVEKPIENLPVSTKIIPVHSQVNKTTACKATQSYPWEAISSANHVHFKNIVVIRIDGKPAFIYKKSGQQNMIALQTFLTPDGRFGTIRGMVYAPSVELTNQLKQHREVADINEPIKVQPLGWIGTLDDTLSYERMRKFLRLSKTIVKAYTTTSSELPHKP